MMISKTFILKSNVAVSQPKRGFAVGQDLKSVKHQMRNVENKPVEQDLFSGKKVIVVGYPGAYTPVCTTKHLPGFIKEAEKFKKKGIDDIYCVAVNDAFVVKHYAESLKANNKVKFLADWDASFSKGVGLSLDLPGLGLRCKRFVMIVDNGKIVDEDVEKSAGECSVSSVESVLKKLD